MPKYPRRFDRFMSLFKDLFGKRTPKHSPAAKEGDNTTDPSKLKDTECEFLFNQLLEGVASGWQPARIVKFFAQLEDRATTEEWVAWLNRFSNKLMTSGNSHRQLASRMLRLGEMTELTPSIREIGEVAAESAQKLLMKGLTLPIWEYAGPDVLEMFSQEHKSQEITLPTEFTVEGNTQGVQSSVEENAPPTQSPPEEVASPTQSPPEEVASPTQSPPEEVASLTQSPPEENQSVNQPPEEIQEVITLDELLSRLQQDAKLVQHIAQQLGIDTDDPQIVFETMINQINAAKTDAESQKIPAPVEAWFNRGLEYAQAGDFEEAITSWDKALELNPNLPQGWHNRGSALAELGRLEEAIASFDQTIALDPNDYQAWNDKGNALYNLQRWEQAITCWQRVLQIQPDYYQAWYNQACGLENLGKLAEAIGCYEGALKINPQFQLALARRNSLQKKLSEPNFP
jgi:Tfp pilus assembly protein PilF